MSEQYCGFGCGIAKETVKEVLDEIKDFYQHDPVTAANVLNDITDMVYETRQTLKMEIAPAV